MPIFLWEGRNQNGEFRSGDIEANSADAAGQKLKGQHIHVTKLKRKLPNIFQLELKIPGASGVSQRDLMIFTRQFATMIDAGVPLVQCLEILSSQMENHAFRRVLAQVTSSVESGSTLAEGLSRHPKVFNRLFVNLVAAGEAGGVLDTILDRLSSYIEKNAKLMKEIKGALTYPVILLVVSVLVTIVLLLFVIPIFQKMFAEYGSALPGPTQFVIDASTIAREYAWAVFSGLGAVVSGIVYLLRTPKGQELKDRVLLKLPAFGPVIRKIAVAKFARTLGTMLSSGVPILDALDIVAGTAGNIVIEKGLKHVKEEIAQGKTMAAPLAQFGVFPSMVVQMIAVGEAAGALDTMLNKIADFYDTEVDAEVSAMTGLIEPALMMFLAVFLGGVVISMYLPVFTMAGQVGAN